MADASSSSKSACAYRRATAVLITLLIRSFFFLTKEEAFVLLHKKRRAKVALADKDCQYDGVGVAKLKCLDDTAAEHAIVSIENR